MVAGIIALHVELRWMVNKMNERMICAYCIYNDGAVYTSIPPKYKCTITNKFQFGLDNCDVEFAPVKHGKWTRYEFSTNNRWRKCSVCGMGDEYINEFGIVAIRNYCPNCGAKMDKVENE